MIVINGKSYIGNNVTISNGKVIIDGKETNTKDDKVINITVEANIESLDVDYCDKIKITGNVSNINTASGDVDIKGNVEGNISTMSGDVKCKEVSGNVSTMSGDIKNKK